jgi:hypothetical protein
MPLDFGGVLEDSSAVVWGFGIKRGGRWLLGGKVQYSLKNRLEQDLS